MHLSRTASRFSIALLFLVVAACSPDSTPISAPTLAPPATPDPGLIGDLVGTTTTLVDKTVTGLLACPTSETYSASKVIGRAGGTLRVGPHTLTIPPYALDRDVPIEGVAPAGNHVVVQFQPHGLKFERKVALTLSYAHCGLTSTLLYSLKPKIVYFDDASGALKILEVLPSLHNLWARSVTGPTDHFSKYALAE